MSGIEQRVAERYQLREAGDLWLDRDDIAKVCPSCAQKMASLGIRKVRASVIFDDANLMASLVGEMDKTAAKGDKWKHGLPKGWTEESLKSFWGKLGGKGQHKVTACIGKIEKAGGIDDPGAFCAALADRMEGKGWRSE